MPGAAFPAAAFPAGAALAHVLAALHHELAERLALLGGWRELLSGAGTRSVSVSASGIFLGSDAEHAIRNHALAGTIDQYELSFEDGAKMRGRFLVQRLDYAGDFNGERTYSVQLESSGPVVPS